MNFGSPPRKSNAKKFLDPLIHNAAASRREAALAERSNRRSRNAHLIGVNEFGIPIPSDNIENYVPGLNNNVAYSMNNFKASDPVMAFAQRKMARAKATYKSQRNSIINNLNRNEYTQSKRQKTQRKRKATRKTRRKN
jgi:hypothetical protein